MARKTTLAAIALTAAIVSAAAPAQAGGQFSINLNPSNAQQQRLMEAGLGIYAIVNEIENGSITQRGVDNIAGIMQGGRNNLGIVRQEGNRHNGTLTQNGNGNSYGLFQFGRGTNAHVNQQGGQSGLGFVFGW